MASATAPVVASAQPTSSTSSLQPVATLKNKKVVFKQQSLGLDQAVSTIAERLSFHTYLQVVSEPLKEFPAAHLPLIAKLVHECDETYSHAATRIHKLLAAQVPAAAATNDSSGPLTLTKAVVEAAVKKVSDRVNWGVENGVAGATIWRLEAKDRSMLPPEFQQICEERWKERNQAKLDIQTALSQLPEAERALYIKSSGNAAPVDKDTVMASPSRAGNSAEASTNSARRGAGRPKKQADSESTARDKEKQEKKIAKEEKEKKEAEVAKKSAAAFASFFTPARPAINRVKTDSELPDYDKTFQPFVTKKNTVCAPINRFANNRVQQSPSSSSPSLKDFLDSAPARRDPLFRPSSRSQQNLQVRALINELNDAEVIGDSKAVRRLTSLLKNRRALPAKLFQFHENARPAYYGTWTKFSPNIRARRPLGKDETLDYDYDSGEDWEEEGDGEVLVSDGSDEDDSDSDVEEEGWLVDDEDEAEAAEIQSETVEEPVNEPSAKRKAKAIAKGKDTKKRKVEKLAAFQKGPCWETEIGECSYDAFKVYRIQLLNDCPYPVDPFAFIPAPVDLVQPPATTDSSTAPQPVGVFAVPVPPVVTSNSESPAVAGPSNRVPSLMKKSIDPASIKNPFPDAHLVELYGLIEGSEKTLKGLVEDLHLVLKRHPGVKKYAIEAKLREVADKSRTADAGSKRWRVSDEAWAAVGINRPS